jgi:hypothetical protein
MSQAVHITMAISPSTHITELARDLVDEVELSRLSPEQLLLKASRLARLVGDGQTSQWLQYELNGYPGGQNAHAQALQFGRIETADAQYGYWYPLAGISGVIATMQAQIQQLNVPSIQFAPQSANPNELVTGWAGATARALTEPANKVLERLQVLTTTVTTLTSVRSRVLGAIHAFAVRVYYERAFAGLAETSLSITRQPSIA